MTERSLPSLAESLIDFFDKKLVAEQHDREMSLSGSQEVFFGGNAIDITFDEIKAQRYWPSGRNRAERRKNAALSRRKKQ